MDTRLYISRRLIVFILLVIGNLFVYDTFAQTQDTLCTPELEEKKILFGLIKKDEAKLAEKKFRKQHTKANPPGSERKYTINYDSLGLVIDSLQRDTVYPLTKEVFGWYPFWEEDLHKTLNYSLLTTVAYFSYEVDPSTGKPKTIHDWSETPLIEKLKSKNKNALLTVTNFGKSDNKRLLKNDKAIGILTDSLTSLLQVKGDGVCINFEDIHKSEKNDFSKFITLLRQKLDAQRKGYKIYLTLPAVDWAKSIDYNALLPIVDQFVIMGYNYYGQGSEIAGPVDPICSGNVWEPFNLNASADYYMEQGIPASKLIMALPFYGQIWETKTGSIGSKVDRYIGARTYEYIKANLGKSKLCIDPVSKNAYYSYITQNHHGRNQFRQCWFNSPSTLSSKIEMIKDKKLNGLGIWALGYDKGYNDLWEVIAEELCKAPSVNTPNSKNPADTSNDHNGIQTGATNSTGTGPLKPNKNSTIDSEGEISGTGTTENKTLWEKLKDISASLQNIKDYQSVLLFAIAFMVVFGGAGLLIAMFRPETRMYFFNSKAYTIYYTGALLVFTMFILRWKGVINDPLLAMTFGFLIGGIGIYFINRFVQRIKRELP